MGRIKSALEIALERTEAVKTDRASVGLFEARQDGKRIANAYLAEASGSLEAELKKQPAERQAGLRQGIFEVLAPQITLPAGRDDLARIEAAGRGLATLISGGRFAAMLKQFAQIMSQYLEEAAQLEEAVHRQYAPKLRQKSEELSRRLGQEVRIDPLQDPEFVVFYNQNMNALKANYQAPADQVREEAMRLWAEQNGG